MESKREDNPNGGVMNDRTKCFVEVKTLLVEAFGD